MGSGAFPDLQFQAGSGDQEASNTGKLKREIKGVFWVIAEKEGEVEYLHSYQ